MIFKQIDAILSGSKTRRPKAWLTWWAQFASYDDARAAYEKERKAKPALVVIEDKPEQIALFPADERRYHAQKGVG